MAWRGFRELFAWVLFATVTAVHLHSRTQLELCMTQLESSHAQMRANVTLPCMENSGASFSDEPSGGVRYPDPLPDAELADATSGGTLLSSSGSCAHGSASAPIQL
jgi:hypothetical protein